MEYEEAIRILKEERKLYESDYCTSGDGTPDGTLMAAIDEAIEELEKQIPKKPVYDETIRKNGKKVRYHIICPGCYSFSPGIGDEHCVRCGQAIDWSEWGEDK